MVCAIFVSFFGFVKEYKNELVLSSKNTIMMKTDFDVKS